MCINTREHTSETMDANTEQVVQPQAGVSEVCRQWSIFEDGAIAHRLQDQEFSEHYLLNRDTRRAVAGDICVARIVQRAEDNTGTQRLVDEQLQLMELEERDERVAKRLQQELEQQERMKLKSIEEADRELAKKMQEKEQRKYQRYQEKKRQKELERERRRMQGEAELTQIDGTEAYVKVSSEDQLNQVIDNVQLEDGLEDKRQRFPPPNRVVPLEDRDADVARCLQAEERNRAGNSKHDELEAKDYQLAKVMQEQEVLKARRMDRRGKSLPNRREKSLDIAAPNEARRSQSQAAGVKKQINSKEQCKLTDVCEYGQSSSTNVSKTRQYSSELSATNSKSTVQQVKMEKTSDCAVSKNFATAFNSNKGSAMTVPKTKIDDSQICVMQPLDTLQSGHVNIATAIDPTYRRHVDAVEQANVGVLPSHGLNLDSKSQYNGYRVVDRTKLPATASGSAGAEDGYYDCEEDAPPYMPVAGARRPAALEKKRHPSGKGRSKDKDGQCKQQ